MKYSILFLFLIVLFAKTHIHGQVWLPGDTVVQCSSSITIQANALSVSAGTGSYLVSSIPFDSTLFPGTGTIAISDFDDYHSAAIPLPFTFSFFENLYTQTTVSGNGYLSFDISLAGLYSSWTLTDSAPSSNLPLNSVFGVYHDMNVTDGGSIYYRTEGIAPNRMFIVEFHNVHQYFSDYLQSSTAILLHESNIIDIHILDKPVFVEWNSGNALLAIQNATGDSAFVPEGRNTGPWSATHEAWRFAPNAPCDSFKLQWYVNGTYAGISDSLSFSQIDTVTAVRVEMVSFCSGQSGVSATDEMLIMPQSAMSVSPTDTSICLGESVQLSVSGVADAIWSTGDSALSVLVEPIADTTLYVQSYNSGSCTQYFQTNILVNPLPDTPAIILNDSLLLLVSDIPCVIWYLNDSALGTASGDTLEVQSNGLYFAINYNEFGCVSSSDTIEITTFSIPSFVQENAFAAFPNPTSGIISFSGEIPLNNTSISLYSSTGSLLMTEKVSSDDYYLDVRPFLRGSTICHEVINAGNNGIFHIPVVYIQ